MIRVALLSRWHVHSVDYAREAREHPDIDVRVVWDDHERGRAWALELGVPFEDDLERVLGSDVDAVIVTTATRAHPDVIARAIRAGKHVFSEKVLALSVREADALLQAAADAGVQLMLSLPRLTEGRYLVAQRALDDGLLGDLTLVRCRVAHDGAIGTAEHLGGFLPERFYDPHDAGGGAFVDLGAHPVYLTNRLAGPARAVTARLASVTARGVDDNAVAIVEYDHGRLGVLETSFVSHRTPFTLELHGTNGTLLVEDQRARILARDAGPDWRTLELPPSLPTPLQQWVRAIREGVPSSITRDDMRALTVVNEAAALSQREGRRVLVEFG